MVPIENIGKLGFGLMRLPKKDGDIDIDQLKEMVDLFMDAGFNYFDTAWAYPGSEEAIRLALVDRYPRDSYLLATKNAAWISCGCQDDAIKQFETSLKNAGVDHFDYYLLHNLGEGRTDVFDRLDLWNYFLRMRSEGKIGHLGFSAHSSPEELESILSDHPEAEFVQLQINYADWNDGRIQSGRCYEIARKYNVPIIVMEPVKGGLLATPPQQVKDIFKRIEPDSEPASWALRFAADLDGVITVLSGMSNVEQMKDNIRIFKDFVHLDDEHKDALAEAGDILRSIPLIPCTSCDYCAKVCPKDIGISGSFTAYNQIKTYGNYDVSLRQMNWLVGGHGRRTADNCIQCGECERVCPQHIGIINGLKAVTTEFELDLKH